MQNQPPPRITSHAGLPPRAHAEPAIFLLPNQLHWELVLPGLADRSPRHALLRHDPATGATTMLIWIPPDFQVPAHWHSGTERHLVISGSITMLCDNRATVMMPSTFNLMPARLVHSAWTGPGDGCLLLNDVDTFWDVNWVGDAPTG
jgi:hypothetical protein